MSRKTGVHPNTSFDYTASAANTPVGSEDEADLCDLKKAQNLSINMSTIDNSVPNRVIRTIVRGDFALVQEEADQGRLRQRKYLVATDLSEESVYALEWTIGTILRDGDTLYAVYAVDEETGTGNKAIAGSEADNCALSRLVKVQSSCRILLPLSGPRLLQALLFLQGTQALVPLLSHHHTRPPPALVWLTRIVRAVLSTREQCPSLRWRDSMLLSVFRRLA